MAATSLWSRFWMGLVAFHETFLSSAGRGRSAEPRGRRLGGDYCSYPGRMLRYEVLWAFFENTAYADAVHDWARRHKQDYALYENIRHVFSCGQRLGSFWGTHIWGGSLDPDAGDGKHAPSALPILTGRPDVRTALAKLWKDSNWQVRKDTVALWGSVMGDVAIKVEDDAEKAKPYLCPVDPRTLADVTYDAHRNVIGYVTEEARPDPREAHDPAMPIMVVFREEAEKVPGGVRYRTFLDGEPYAWDGHPDGAEWVEPYPFVPMVVIQHWDVGLGCGWAEAFPILAKMREADNGPSALIDLILKSVNAPWLYAGVDAPKKGGHNERILEFVRSTSTAYRPGEYADRPRSDAYDVPALFGPIGASAQALVSGLNIAACRDFFADLRENLEDEFPELVRESKLAMGDASGKALRYSRQRIEVKAHGRRAGYDAALTRACQMAMTLGGIRRYEGYTAFDEGSFDRGDLDFRIGDRPVFQVDPVDQLERKAMFWGIGESAVRSGYPLELWLRDMGYTPDQMAEFLAAREANDARMLALAAAQAAMRTPNPENNAPHQAPTNGEASRQAAQRPGGM